MPSDPQRLIGDIGGTNARFALVETAGAFAEPGVLPTREHSGLAQTIRAWLGARPMPRELRLAVAGPVRGGCVQLTNLGTRECAHELRAALGAETVTLVNDFAAVALAHDHLQAADLRPIGGGEADPRAPVGLLGPGTGLGVAGLAGPPGARQLVSSEGGHVSLAAQDEHEARLIGVLRERFGHVSAERVLSGPGLGHLHQALARLQGATVPALEPAAITERALAGSDTLCVQTLDQFCRFLGSFAGDLALTLGARGGICIAGGIVPRITDYLAASEFRARFEAKGRFREWLQEIPCRVIAHPWPALVGLAHSD